MPRPTIRFSHFISIALVLLCTWSLVVSTKWLTAEFFAKKVNDQIELWNSSNTVNSLEEWELALDHINTAIWLHNNQAEFHRLKGLIYIRRPTVPYPENEDLDPMRELEQTIEIQTQAWQDALTAYRNALLLRPAWAPEWISLVYLKAVSEEFDDEFIKAISRAYQLGSNLDFLQSNLTDISLRFFQEIQTQEALKKMQLTHLAKALGYGRVHVDLINSFGLMEELCQQLADNSIQLTNSAGQICQQALQ